MSEEEKNKRIGYLNFATSDEKLYVAILNKKVEMRKKGIKITIRQLVEKYLWQGIINDK